MSESEERWTIKEITVPVDRSVPKKEEWSDHLAAIQFTTRVFNKLNEIITEDFVLASLNEEQKDFIREQVKQAILLRRLIPNKHIGETIFTTLIAESLMIAVLNRNIDKNVLLKIIGQVRDEDLREVVEETPVNAPKTLGGKMVSAGKGLLGGK